MKLDASKPIKSVNLNGTDAPLDILNIAYGTTPPADVTRLWVPLENRPANVEISGDSLQSAVDAFRIMTTTVPSSGAPNYYFPSVTMNGKIYQFGGASGSTSDKYDIVREYDPATDTMVTKTATLAKKAYSTSAVAIGGKIYIFGGQDGSSQYSSLIQEYDPATDTMVTKSATLKNGVYSTSAVAINGKAYVFGGIGASAASRNYIQEYDPVTDTVTQKTAVLIDTACRSTSAVAINGKAYIFGGSGGTATNSDDIQEYDPVTDTIVTKPTTLAKAAVALSSVAINGKAYIFGGISGASYYDTIQEYDPVTDAIVTKPTTLFGSAHGGYSAAVVDGKTYIWGGRGYYNIQEYTPKAYLGANHLKIFASVYRGEEYQLVTNIVNNKNVQVKLFMTSAFLGDEDGYAKEQDAYVFNREKQQWQALDGTSMTTDMLNALAELGVT